MRFSTGFYNAIQEQNTVDRKKRKNSTSNDKSTSKDSVGKNICIVTTTLPTNLQDEVQKFCKTYKAKQYKDWNENVTHMVIYPSIDNSGRIQAKRTVKYVLGIIKGVWIVSFKCK